MREFHAATPEEIARVGALPETAKTPALVEAMVAMDERSDGLKSAQTAGWKTPPGEAGAAPAHQATLLWEQLRELARTEHTAKRPDDFRRLLADSEHAAAARRDTLRTSLGDAAKLDTALNQTTQSCTACHKVYRNEKPSLFSKMTISPERCPLCGQPNDCARAAPPDGKGECWCVKETFPPELLARVPEEARGCACICKLCLAKAQREK